MSAISWVRIALGALGLVTWLVGQRRDVPVLLWVGIGLIVVALLLRFVDRGRR